MLGADFSDECATVTVPAAATPGTQTYTIQKFFTVDDDELNEIEQSFALIAVIETDVPSNCVHIVEDVVLNYCGSGATEIRITDNDRKNNSIMRGTRGYKTGLCTCYSILADNKLFLSLSAMVIGFTDRRQTVSEGLDEFPLELDVAILRVSEREHRILYRVLSSGTARVVSYTFFDSLDFDARLGIIQADPIEQMDILLPGRDSILPLQTAIRNDFVPEDEECFSIQISPVDIPGLRELFMCDYSDDSRNIFCVHTICIENDDGRFQYA